MDTDILLENKDCFYGADFLEELTNDYQWSSLLDATDASPSEILADAAPVLVPPISPNLSVKSSPTESSNSDSGSEDDSKNGSPVTSDRQSSQSPFDWLTGFEEEPSGNLNPEDVEQFLQKASPIACPPLSNFGLFPEKESPDRCVPVVSIENGIIKGIGVKSDRVDKSKILKVTSPIQCNQNGSIKLQNSYFKVVHENNNAPQNSLLQDKKIVLNDQIHLVVEQKKVPNILKRPAVTTNGATPNVVIPTDSTKGGNIVISPYPKSNGVKMSPPRNNIVMSAKIVASNVTPVQPVQNIVIPSKETESPKSPVTSSIDVSHLSEAEIRALKKQQRMIKNRESACQSRQKKKEYVTALEQQLLEAQHEIARLRLENKLLRDQLENNGRCRKIPRLDASLLIPKKNIAVIFAMVFMVSLNFNVIGWNNNKPFVGPSGPHQTRHLLWTEDNSAEVVSRAKRSLDYDQPLNESISGKNCNSTKNSDLYMNQTESIRIVGELNRWIGGGKTLNWTYDVPRKKRRVYMDEDKINGALLESYKLLDKLNIDSNLVDFPSSSRKNIKERTRLRRLRRGKDIDFTENDVYDYGLYPKARSSNEFDLDFGEWKSLIQALQRRDDTFYVVGVGKGEHLLLPAVSHNDTRPPKMALILPAKNGNDSIMADHITLMQIDCSIVNTTLVKLKSDDLPESLRKKPNEIKVEDRPENKSSLGLRLIPNIEDSLDVPQNTSGNLSNYPLTFKSTHAMNAVGKEDAFSQYLISKFEETKNDSKSTVINDNNKNNLGKVRRYVGKGAV